MKKLIRLELKKFALKPHLTGIVVANIIILLVSVFASALLLSGTDTAACRYIWGDRIYICRSRNPENDEF